jgi:hypothetical protein
MHPNASIAEALPRIYRRVLDAVARLEQLGARREAAKFRNSAIQVYSAAWNAKTHRRLEEILGRAEETARDLERRQPLRVA